MASLEHRGRREWHTFVDGVGLTFMLSAASIVGSVLLGMVGAFMRGSHSRLWRGMIEAYVWAFRNTPPLVQSVFPACAPALRQAATAWRPRFAVPRRPDSRHSNRSA